MTGFLLWCVLLVVCWPLALLALVLWPLVWLFAFLRALLYLPTRVLGGRPAAAAN